MAAGARLVIVADRPQLRRFHDEPRFSVFVVRIDDSVKHRADEAWG
jgi:hypothetical protein